MWIRCLYVISLNLSNPQIAVTVGLGISDVRAMTDQSRGGLVARAPAVTLLGDVEIAEVYVVAGRGEYARDEDGNGFREVHVNTIEGF